MVYTYTPTYYSSLHDSITSLCKTILPFSFKKRRLPAASKQQSDNLKWQQESFHQILNLIGLCKECIVSETEVSAFRTQLLDFHIAAPADREQAAILRDKLLFLQELFYAKCISEEEYHSSKRPLLQRLAVQGAEIEASDVIVAGPKENSEEEWSVIDLKDENCLLNKENHLHSQNKSKHRLTMKQIKGVGASVFSIVSSQKLGKVREGRDATVPTAKHFGLNNQNEMGLLYGKNPFWDSQLKCKESETRSILMPESVPIEEPINGDKVSGDKVKKKTFRSLFHKEQSDEHGGGGDYSHDLEERAAKSAKKQWGFDGLKKWKSNINGEDATTPLKLSERSNNGAPLESSCRLVESPIGEGPDMKQIKKKLHPDGSASDFFIDKVLGDKIKKELSRIQTELSSTNPSLQFSNDQIEAISTKLPVDKADLKKFFPKSWCDQYGDVVLDVVRNEFKDHVGEMENMRNTVREKRGRSKPWVAFEDDDDDDENCDPNFFVQKDHPFPMKQGKNYPQSNSDHHTYSTKVFGTNSFS